MTISTILIVKFDIDEIRTVDPCLFLFSFIFFFHFHISFDSEKICRYFWLNLLVPKTYKRYFQYLSLIPEHKIHFSFSLTRSISIDIYMYIRFLYHKIYISIRSWLHVPKISILMRTIFLFRQCRLDGKKYFHFLVS